MGLEDQATSCLFWARPQALVGQSSLCRPLRNSVGAASKLAALSWAQP